jgi:hypothetical protein
MGSPFGDFRYAPANPIVASLYLITLSYLDMGSPFGDFRCAPVTPIVAARKLLQQQPPLLLPGCGKTLQPACFSYGNGYN